MTKDIFLKHDIIDIQEYIIPHLYTIFSISDMTLNTQITAINLYQN